MDLRIETLRRFVVLAEELNLTRAAARLHMSQQGLSAQLKQLETELGVRLLARTTQRVELTAAGAAFLDRARTLVADAEAAVRAAREAAGRAHLVLACQIDAQWLLAEQLDAVRVRAHNLDVVVLYILDETSLGALTPSRIDAVVLWAPVPLQVADQHAVLAHEEVQAVLRADDPLATADAVPIDALGGRTLWLWAEEVGSAARRRFVEHLRALPETVMAVPSAGPAQELMIQAVRDKGGYTTAPSSYLRRVQVSGVVALPFDPPLRLPLVLAWRGMPSPGLQRLLAHASLGRTTDDLFAKRPQP